jgi:hypothetical protein
MPPPEPGKTFWWHVNNNADHEFVLPIEDPTLRHVRQGLSVYRSTIAGIDAGIGIKTLHEIPKGGFVAIFTGVWAYNDDVDASPLRAAPCVRQYAAGFGDLGTYVVDRDSVATHGLLKSTSHRIMCLVRHGRAESDADAGACPRVRYDPSDTTTPSDVAGLFNHADQGDYACNCSCESCIVDSGDGMRLALICATTRAVGADEELRWDYKWGAMDDDDDDDDDEEGRPFNIARDTTPWAAPATDPPVPDIDSYQIVGREHARNWGKQLYGSANGAELYGSGGRAALLKPEWCGPRVHLRLLPNGMKAVVIVTQPSGFAYQNQLPVLVMR